MRAAWLWGMALGGGLGAASCGELDSGDAHSGGTGGHSAEGGLAGSGTGGVTALGGHGGQLQQGPTWPPPPEALEGTLDELVGMDCVIELDEGDDGEIDRRWGIDYLEQHMARKLIWSGADDGEITVVSLDENERPWLACSPGACERISEVEADFPADPRHPIRPCPEGSAPSDGGYQLEAMLYTNPPDSVVELEEHGTMYPYTATFWLAADGRPTRVLSFVGGDESRRSCFFPDGTPSQVDSVPDYPVHYLTTYGPNQQVLRVEDDWVEWTESWEGTYTTRTCNSEGWETSYEDAYWEKTTLSTTTYDLGGAAGLGGGGGAAGDHLAVAHTTLEYDLNGPDFVADPDVVSTIDESDDGLSFEVAVSSEAAGWSESFTLNKANGRPHVVSRLLDDSGRVLAERIDVTVDGEPDLRNTYTYSGQCLAGENPQFELIPTHAGLGEAELECAFQALPEYVWNHYEIDY